MVGADRISTGNTNGYLPFVFVSKYPEQKVEFIIVNDHSNDNTEKNIKDFIKKDKVQFF